MQDFEEADPNLLAINGSRLVRATKSVLSGRLKDDPLAEEVFNFVTSVLKYQKKKSLFKDNDEYESIMDTRGTPVQSGNTAAAPPGAGAGVMQFDEKSVSTIAAAIGYQVGRGVAAGNRESKELEATEMSLKSASALSTSHNQSFQTMCKFEKQDFLTDVQVDDKKKDKAIQNITSLWTAETKPNWFPENLGAHGTMEDFSKALCDNKVHLELSYEYLINWVVRCAFDASDFEGITPQYEGDGHGLEKPTLKFMEGSVSRRCGVGTACPDGLLKKDLMDIDGIPIEAKPAFKSGGAAYTLNSLRQSWTYESLAQIEGPLSSERRYGVGILSSWNHWVFMKAVRPVKEGQKMKVTWCSLQNDGLDSLKTVTTYILKTIQLFSSEENSDKDDSEADENKGQLLKNIDEVESFSDGGESGAEQEPESSGNPPQTQTLKVTNQSNLHLFGGSNARLGYRQPGVNYGACMNPPTLNRGELIFLDVFSKKPPTLDEKICSWLDSNIISDS